MPAFCKLFNERWGDRRGGYRGQQATYHGGVQAESLRETRGISIMVE